MEAEISKRVNPNKPLLHFDSLLSQLYFQKRQDLDADGEAKRLRKGGSTTLEERREVLSLGEELQKVEMKTIRNVPPMIFDGWFGKEKQTFLIDSGCTTMIIGRTMVERLGLPTRQGRKLQVEYANETQGWLQSTVNGVVRI